MAVSRKSMPNGVVSTAALVKKTPDKLPKVTVKRAAPVAKKTSVTAKVTSAKKVVGLALAVKPAKLAKLANNQAITAAVSSNAIAIGSTLQDTKARLIEKIRKPKLIRDSFTMPEAEYAALGEVKKACLKAGFEVKKSELLRIGVALVRKMALAVLKQKVGALSPLKPGRPPKQ